MLLTDPVPPPTARALRGLVLGLHRRPAAERTRFPVRVCVGGRGPTACFTVRTGDRLDLAARAEVLGALLDVVPDGARWAWVERRGTTDWHAADGAWLAAALQVAAESGHDLGFVVVTRKGWRDPRTGTGRTWVRPRPDRTGRTA